MRVLTFLIVRARFYAVIKIRASGGKGAAAPLNTLCIGKLDVFGYSFNLQEVSCLKSPPPSHAKLIFIALLFFALGACSFEAKPEAPQTDLPDLPETLDEQFLAIGEEVSGFAGLYYDDNNDLVVNVARGGLGVSSISDIEAALVKEFGQEVFETVGTLSGQSVEPTLKTQEVKYSFEELTNFLEKFEREIEEVGINIVDIDEVANEIYLGVENEAIANKLRTAFTQLELPKDAITVAVEQAPIPLATTLDSKVRPTQGGINVRCTLGFNTTLNGVKGFITNSHCTSKFGQVDGRVFSQGGERIGVETVDPKFGGANSSVSCVLDLCRYSDAAFIKYDSGVNVGFGKIARVSNRPRQEITPKNPLQIIGKRTDNSQLYSGRIVEKVGHTTGITAGKIFRTCISSTQDGTNKKFVCQYRVNADSDGGDSGSPVYTIEGAGVRISGVLWGGRDKTFIFSPMSGIERDFGRSFTVN